VQRSLISKLTIAICSILLVAMALFAALTIQGLHTLLLAEKVTHTDSISETLIRTTRSRMLHNDSAQVFQMFSDAKAQEGIERIRLVNKFGVITYSTDSREVGSRLDKSAEGCTMCHASAAPLTSTSSMNRSRTFTALDGTPLLGLAKAIYNEPACVTAPCHVHAKDDKILGVIDIVVSLKPLHSSLDHYGHQFIYLTIGLLLVIAVAITICTLRLVNRPVRNLLEQTQLVAAGRLDTAVHEITNDELGELATAFNQMTRSLQQARIELENWNHTLESKVEERTEELNRMQSQLVRSEKLASLGELVAGIAHEINNPLTGILMFSSLVLDDARLHDALKGDIATVVRETERCAKIVRGLLDFSRRSMPEKTWASLNEIMVQAIELVRHHALFHDVTIETAYTLNLPDIFIDANQVEQVFVNIILNAAQAMDGYGTLRVSTGLTTDGTWIFAKISDTGCGIPPEHLGKIFDPFFSTKEHQGTGLGLSVSYGIINNHGGSIEVQSAVGQGTTFTIELPLLQVVAESIIESPNHDYQPD
jgi:two-component system NtrC family sensor kinase